MMERIGISSCGIYMPDQILSSSDLEERSGIPKAVIEEKFGLKQKYKAAPEEHVSDMAFKACLQALKGRDPQSVDALIYYGSEYKDYYLWPVGPLVQEKLGLKNIFSFEIMALCATGAIALKTAKYLIQCDPDINQVLLVAASKEGDLINYRNERARFMYNFGDGAGAALVERGCRKNNILEAAAISDGAFALDVYVPAGGSVQRPPFHKVTDEDFMLDVPRVEEMKWRLDPVSLPNFIRVIEKAVQKSGCKNSDISFLGITHMKRSFYEDILKHFSLSWEQTYYLEDYGHVQAADQIIILYEAEKRGLLKSGDMVVLAGAGTGYTWSAAVLRWGE